MFNRQYSIRRGNIVKGVVDPCWKQLNRVLFHRYGYWNPILGFWTFYPWILLVVQFSRWFSNCYRMVYNTMTVTLNTSCQQLLNLKDRAVDLVVGVELHCTMLWSFLFDILVSSLPIICHYGPTMSKDWFCRKRDPS